MLQYFDTASQTLLLRTSCKKGRHGHSPVFGVAEGRQLAAGHSGSDRNLFLQGRKRWRPRDDKRCGKQIQSPSAVFDKQYLQYTKATQHVACVLAGSFGFRFAELCKFPVPCAGVFYCVVQPSPSLANDIDSTSCAGVLLQRDLLPLLLLVRFVPTSNPNSS